MGFQRGLHPNPGSITPRVICDPWINYLTLKHQFLAFCKAKQRWKIPISEICCNGVSDWDRCGHSLSENSQVKRLQYPWTVPARLLCPCNSPGHNTGVGSLSLLQGIFPTQGSNPGLPHCRQILYQLSHKGSPRILEWVAYPFSSGSHPDLLHWR